MRLTCSLFRGFALAHGRQRCEPCYVGSLAGYPPYNYFSYKCFPPPLSLFLPPTPTLQRLAIKAHKRRCSLGSISILPQKSLQLPRSCSGYFGEIHALGKVPGHREKRKREERLFNVSFFLSFFCIRTLSSISFSNSFLYDGKIRNSLKGVNSSKYGEDMSSGNCWLFEGGLRLPREGGKFGGGGGEKKSSVWCKKKPYFSSILDSYAGAFFFLEKVPEWGLFMGGGGSPSFFPLRSVA